MISGLTNLDYENRLKRCNLTTLEIRRYRADLLEVYRIVHGIDDLDSGDFFVFRRGGVTRGHSFHILKQRSNLLVRKFCFSRRVVEHWNALPEEAVSAPTINAFKNIVDPLLRQRGGLTISQRRLPTPITRATDDSYMYYM